MNEYTDEYNQRKRAGEEAGDMLAEEARLAELGLSYPLNMMHQLYYEGGAESLDVLKNYPAELNAVYGEEALL